MASTALNLLSITLLLSILTNASGKDILRGDETIRDGETIVSANGELNWDFSGLEAVLIGTWEYGSRRCHMGQLCGWLIEIDH